MSQPGTGRVTENLRVRRTRKLLRDALVELMEERGFDRLTVGEITGRAMVSRSAFYRNYHDKFHLAEQIFDDAMAALLGTVTDDTATRSPAERWVAFFEHIDRYHRFYGVLLSRKGSPWFATKMRAALTDMVERHLRPPAEGRAPADDGVRGGASESLPATVLGAMFTQSVTWWLEHDRPCPPEEIAARSARLAGAVIAAANGGAESAGA
ncbi:TetR/AcrR family transcriptional regulator [Streptomyces mangrovisoli]|uniref:TetR family transcriptional regulator n=1 Tax=Streptomyces mangrovisoli TaxID=1428628 RepID=A0A1J4NMR2_9ACTN|nr:TetR/AcrR family transcriptional regulator [Streptomyces mangrovisoli]OIJ63587.1 TetR family transcriptional regulator [Streptomyces mangrovisoli]